MGKGHQARTGSLHDFQCPLQFNHPVLCPHKHSHTHCTQCPHLICHPEVSPSGFGLLTGGCGHIFAIVIATGLQFCAKSELKRLHVECLITDQLSSLPPFRGPTTQISSQEDLEGPVMHAVHPYERALKLLSVSLWNLWSLLI